MINFMSEIYYTYAYLRLDGTPYYIGKGCGKRCYIRAGRTILPPKDLSRILILKSNLTEQQAIAHEVYMIAVLGRKDLGTGILRNRTDGGEGTSGRIVSVRTRQKHSRSLYGRTVPPERGLKISLAKKGKSGKSGQANGNSKLTDDDRRQIAKEYIPGKKGNGTNGNSAELSKRFGVNPNQIARISKDPRWTS